MSATAGKLEAVPLGTAFWVYVAGGVLIIVGGWISTQALGAAWKWWRSRKPTPWRGV